jgi:hypothetical protein
VVSVRAHFPVAETDDGTRWSGGEVLMRRKLRVLVTGQTPRLDVLTRLSLAASDHDIRIEGALDDMGSDQIVRHMAPRSDVDALRVKLSSGEVRACLG